MKHLPPASLFMQLQKEYEKDICLHQNLALQKKDMLESLKNLLKAEMDKPIYMER